MGLEWVRSGYYEPHSGDTHKLPESILLVNVRVIIYLTHIHYFATVTYMKPPKTLQEAISHFSDPNRAFDDAVNLRWPDAKVVCPRCGSDKHSFIKTRRLWFCYPCKRQFTVKVGTVMEDSALGLDKWMTAIW